MTRYIVSGLCVYLSYLLLTYSRNQWYTDNGNYAMVGGMLLCFVAGYLAKEEN